MPQLKIKPNYGKFNVLNVYCASKLKNRWAVAPRTVLLIIVIFQFSRVKEYLETGAQCLLPNVYSTNNHLF